MLFTLKFLKELPQYATEQPYQLHGFPELTDEQRTNCVFEHVEHVAAENVRGNVKRFRLEEHGFEFVRAPTRCTLTADTFEGEDTQANKTVEDYIHETMDLVKERLNADSVLTIDWRVSQNYREDASFTTVNERCSFEETHRLRIQVDYKEAMSGNRPLQWRQRHIVVIFFD